MPPTPRTSRRGLAAAVVLAAALFASACEPTAPPPPPPPSPPAVATTAVACPAGGSITIATSIATPLRNLLAAAKRDNVSLCGHGYRSTARQIELRRKNCGTSHYAIYQMPASGCTPPTAIPGRSMHESGLAVDFGNCSTRTTACYRWLATNASRFGFKNLPSEPWHWSTNGH